MNYRFLMLLPLLAAGCAIDQDKEIEIYQREIRLTEDRVAYVPGEPLTMKQAILLANQNDEQLAQQGEAYLRAVIAQRRTLANFLPTVDLVPVYSRREAATGGNSNQDKYFDAPLQGSINLFNGFQDVNRAWRDEFFARQRRSELLYEQELLLVDTAAVFFQVLRSESSVSVLESSLQLQDERFRDARGRVEVGLASPLVASQTEAQIAGTRTTLISARADVVQSRSRLALLTAEPVQGASLADDFTPPALPTLDEMLGAARVSRDDLKAAEDAVAAARHDVDVAIGQYLPSISLNLDVFLYRESVPDTRTWDALLVANIPIFSAGRIEQDVRTAWSNLRTALLARSYLERLIRSQVEQAYSAVQASADRLSQLRVQVAAARQALIQAEESYKAGLATNLDRITAQDALLQSQLQLVSEEYDRKLLHLTLLQRAGQLREQFVAFAGLKPRE
jgi:outer membrane protein TolC